MPHRSDHYASALGGLSSGLGRGWMLGMQLERQELLKKQRNLALRQADLKIRGELREFFKANADPVLLEEQFNEVMNSIPGEDINSPRNKQFKKTLIKMNEETKSRIRKMVMRIAPDLKPGELANYTVRFMKKELTVPGLMKIVQQTEDRAEQRRLQASIADIPRGEGRGEGILETALGAVPRSPAAGSALARIAGQRRLIPENVRKAAVAKETALGQVRTTETLRRQKLEIPIAAKKAAEVAGAKAKQAFRNPIGPRIANFLGLNPKDSGMSRNDLFALKSDRHPRGIIVPTEKQIEELQGKEAALRKVMRTSEAILNRIQNKPQVLGAPGAIARTLSSIKAATVGFLNLWPEIADKIPGYSRMTQKIDRSLSGMTSVALQSAQVRSAVISLTYQGGALADQTGRGFSDKDFVNISRQIGAGTSNPDVMAGVIRSYNLIQHDAFNLDFESKTNTTKFIGLPGVDREAPFADLSTKAFPGIIRKLLNDRQLRLFDLEISKRLGGSP
jgi:hypothetical protein